MCGLFLVLERNRLVHAQRAHQATQALRHRGPDGTGEWQFHWHDPAHTDAPVVAGYAGHTRLSIQDLATRSDQPFRRGGRTLVYNGELYNFRALRDQLTRTGSRFETGGDTEVLLELLSQHGVNGLNQANGMWAFCLFDEARGQLVAARDRYGKKPLFVYRDNETVCLASEIAPILGYLGRRPVLRQEALDDFLCDGWLFPDADGGTHIAGIQQVPAGCAWTFDLKRWEFQQERYFDLATHARSAPPDPGQLVELLRDAVLSRLVSDRPVGLLLSGGVDSSLILSILYACGLAGQVHCFTGDAGKSDDAVYARQCVEQLGIRAINVPLDYGTGGMEGFLQVCRRQEKPFPFIGNALAMPQLYAQIAAHNVPVVLDGTGGDEIFAGYWDRTYRFALMQARAEGDEAWIADSLRANADNHKAMIAARAVLGDATLQAHGITPTQALADPPAIRRFLRPDLVDRPARDALATFEGTLGDALVCDAARGRLPEWLWQNDRNAMASGIENRSPLLDHRLAPWMHSAMRGKFSGPWNKLELRTVFSDFQPLATQWRRDKQGFRWVYNRFLRSNRSAVLELVASSQLLPHRVDVSPLLDAARHDDAVLECALLQRMLCIAGLEETMGLAADSRLG